MRNSLKHEILYHTRLTHLNYLIHTNASADWIADQAKLVWVAYHGGFFRAMMATLMDKFRPAKIRKIARVGQIHKVKSMKMGGK